MNRIGLVDSERSEATREALRNFQAVVGFGPTGEVAMLTVIELRSLRAGE